jgi:hypothetical protein
LANHVRLPADKIQMILHCLVEGNSIRGTARLCDVEKGTVLNFNSLQKSKRTANSSGSSGALSGDFNAKLDLFGEAQTEEEIDALAEYVDITIKRRNVL